MEWYKLKDQSPMHDVMAVVLMKSIDSSCTFYKLARYNGGWNDAEYTKDLGKSLEEVCGKEYSVYMWYPVSEIK